MAFLVSVAVVVGVVGVAAPYVGSARPSLTALAGGCIGLLKAAALDAFLAHAAALGGGVPSATVTTQNALEVAEQVSDGAPPEGGSDLL